MANERLSAGTTTVIVDVAGRFDIPPDLSTARLVVSPIQS